MLGHAALAEGHEETPAFHKYVTGKGKTIWISSSDNCGHFSLGQLNWTGDSFLKASCSAESETMSINLHTPLH